MFYIKIKRYLHESSLNNENQIFGFSTQGFLIQKISYEHDESYIVVNHSSLLTIYYIVCRPNGYLEQSTQDLSCLIACSAQLQSSVHGSDTLKHLQ